eukprot:CAMPEP_0182460636 /NCGR_PEP_ID=MMETSP1319-20130603/5450_1 /TAXON_ID=172717 /ORGANISM="Bolidomonas pacifica, Strain RCC208" /LENGTH=146 /DNA_ID=CAMNT_0024659771 /DNA_START=509 /DNA_END=946 /DNA_ORIENTATION=+
MTTTTAAAVGRGGFALPMVVSKVKPNGLPNGPFKPTTGTLLSLSQGSSSYDDSGRTARGALSEILEKVTSSLDDGTFQGVTMKMRSSPRSSPLPVPSDDGPEASSFVRRLVKVSARRVVMKRKGECVQVTTDYSDGQEHENFPKGK